MTLGDGGSCCRRLSPCTGASVRAMAPFPLPAHRTRRADLPHPARATTPRLVTSLRLGFFESAPEVRVLCSAGITRHQRSYDPVRLPSEPPPENDVEAATLIPDGPPQITRIIPTCCAHYPGGSNGCLCRLFPSRTAFPKWPEGRHPHCHFRGLLKLHTRYGPPDCSAAQGDLCREASALPVTRQSRSPATVSIDNYPRGSFPHW